MTNSEMTLLAYLADGLASNPKAFATLIEDAKHGVASPTAEFAAVVEELQNAFNAKRPKTSAEVEALAKTLVGSPKTSKARAGEVLRWGLVERTNPGLAIDG